MARPKSELTKFILSLPLDLPTDEVVRKAVEKDLATTESNVQRVRRMARAKKGLRMPARDVGAPTSERGAPAPLSKSDFIRSRPAMETAAEVVEAARAAGITIDPHLVYKVRARMAVAPMKAPAEQTTRKRTSKAASAQSISGLGAQRLRGPQPRRPVAHVERAAASSMLPRLDDLVRAAADEEVRRETSEIEALRTALARYEGILADVAQARVVARVAVALGAPAPDVPDASQARATLVAALDALASHLRQPVRPPSPKNGEARSADQVKEGPEPPRSDGQIEETGALDDPEERPEPPQPDVQPPIVLGAPPREVVLTAGVDGGPANPAELERAGGEPEPAPRPVGAASPLPLSKDEVRAFFQALAASPAPLRSRPSPTRDREPDPLLALLQRAGPIADLRTDAGAIEELDALDDVTADTTSWTQLPRPVQQLWLSFLTARARRLKDWIAANYPPGRQRMHEVIVRLPAFAHDAKPGHVNGMRPNHGPVGASWEADAEAHLSELRAVAFPEPGAPVSGEASPKAPKKPKKKHREGERPKPERIEWPLRQRVERMRIVLFGGEPREEARQNLQRMLGIGALEWPESNKPRRVDALATSIANGKHDALLVLRGFVAHTESSRLIEAAKQRGTPHAYVDSGYGIAAVREAIEVALQGR